MLSVLLLALLLYIGLVIVFYLRQRALIFAPDPLGGAWRETPRDRGIAYQDIWLKSAGQHPIHGWYLPSTEPSTTKTVLYLHGNNTNLSHQIDNLLALYATGVNVLAIDYRGYGKSPGRSTEQSLYQDAQAAWQYLQQQRQLPASELIIHGRSLGGGVASYLAEAIQPAGLILESTYSSIIELGQEKYPWLPVAALTHTRLNTRARLAQIHCPLCLIHSPDDRTIPFAQAQRLFKAASEAADFVVIRGEHGDGFIQSFPTYQAGLRRFILNLFQP